MAAARSAGDAEDVSMITGTLSSHGWRADMAQHGIAIVLGKVHVQHDQVGLPGLRFDQASPGSPPGAPPSRAIAF